MILDHYSFVLSFNLSNQTISELRAVSQSAAKIQQQITTGLAEEELDYIHRNVRISMIGATTRIENAVLTDAEIDWLDTILVEDSRTTAYEDRRELIQNKLSKDKERSIDEVAGSRAMLHLIYSQAADFSPLTETSIRGLHSQLLQYYAPAEHYRGRYKTASNKVVRRNHATGEETVVLEPSKPGPITESAMQSLIKWYNELAPNHPWTLAVATEFVFRFLAIHPFQDGNGRIGRALFLLALLQSPDESLRAVAPYIAIDRHIEKQREDYYTVLRQCSGGKFNSDPTRYHYESFLRFMLKVVTKAFGDFGFYRKRYSDLQALSPSASAVLQAFKDRPESRLQRRDIVDNTKLPRATVSVALNTLIDDGFIQRRGRGAGVRYQLVF